MRSRESKAFLLETATKLFFCKETLGKGPVVEDNCGVGASIETSDGAKGTHLKLLFQSKCCFLTSGPKNFSGPLPERKG